MFKEPYNVSNYINFLFYGADLKSIFTKTDLSTVYKNKYERLSKTLPTNSAHTMNTAYLIIDSLTTVLENHYPKYLNNDRIALFKKFYNNLNYDRLVFNNNLSLSFIERYTDDNDLWDSIVNEVKYYCSEYSKYIYDDSREAYKILTISIPIIDYSYENNIPDIIDYNPMISLSYYDIIEDIPVIDTSIKNIFTSELKYLINDDRVLKDKLFTELLDSCISLNICIEPINNIRSICREIISYVTEENLHLIVHLQFKMLEKIFSNNLYYDPDFESILIKKLTTIMAIDIAIYNKSLNLDNENLKLLLLAYNYCIIAIQDMIDKIDNDLNNGKKISMFTYKSQLFKSRNKIQERMNSVCLK